MDKYRVHRYPTLGSNRLNQPKSLAAKVNKRRYYLLQKAIRDLLEK